MKVSLNFQYPAALPEILKMLADPEYRKYRLPAGYVKDVRATEEAPGQTRVVTDVAVDTKDLPANLPPAALKLLPKHPTGEVTEVLRTNGPAQENCTISLKLAGIPVEVALMMVFKDRTETTDVDLQGTINVKIPFLGKSIENKAVSKLGSLVKLEVAAAEKYLSEHR
ncbi:hypothetical protein BSR28_08550 [Boudabousia liubingyangii]|uniref:DUF2505 domain-containing protein n=1 Tax=Boudabousia liubingyangii TaxID=1921764 RepID=UPI0009392A1B|nr:DUF2505 domain-containing protein [Boudabousia liubingyangii]OKL46098.1 hypothetical protein BSR28_08550 [Boudabousia liubingyangii]